jgi:hypothetical protein
MLVPLLDWLGLLDMPLLLPVVFAMGVLRGPSDAAKQAMVPDIAELAAVPLERVTGLVGAIERLASTAGAAARVCRPEIRLRSVGVQRTDRTDRR